MKRNSKLFIVLAVIFCFALVFVACKPKEKAEEAPITPPEVVEPVAPPVPADVTPVVAEAAPVTEPTMEATAPEAPVEAPAPEATPAP
ncbi:MAG: hypothetical protein HZB23_14750 [Deltaproteobacteria bacterium]|nr:hypothetical protein [Deltaproteobacteria bacterium]